MKQNIKNLLILIGILLLGYMLYKYLTKEGFSVDGAINGSLPLGGLVNNTYDLVQPDVNTFADLTAPSAPQQSCRNSGTLPMKAGLNMDYKDLLPDVNTSATSYDIDVSDPEVFMYRPSIRATLQNRQQLTADPLRGDLPIVKDSSGLSNNGWFSSRYGEGDNKTDAYFSDYGKEKFRSLTGQKSYPMSVSNEELIMDAVPSVRGDEMNSNWF